MEVNWGKLPPVPDPPFAEDRAMVEVGCCHMNLVVLDGRAGYDDSQLHGGVEVQGDDRGCCMGGHDR